MKGDHSFPCDRDPSLDSFRPDHSIRLPVEKGKMAYLSSKGSMAAVLAAEAPFVPETKCRRFRPEWVTEVLGQHGLGRGAKPTDYATRAREGLWRVQNVQSPN